MWWIIIIAIVFAVIMTSIQTRKMKAKNDDIKENFNNILETENFKTDKVISTSAAIPFELRVDTSNKKIALCNYADEIISFLSFNEIVDCIVVSDNTTVIKGGKSGALVGGLIAGPTGAIIGSSKSSKDVINHMQIKIITSDISKSLYVIPLISTEINRDSLMYRQSLSVADEVHSVLMSIISQKESSDKNASESYEDKLRKLKALFDENILTEEEYNHKKKLLLEKIS